MAKGTKDKIFNQPVKSSLSFSYCEGSLASLIKKRPGDSTANLDKNTGIFISLKADTPGGLRENKDKLQYVFDSVHKVNVNEDVLVKSNRNNPSADSLQSAGKPRQGRVISISESRSRDSSRDMITEVNTILF